MRSVDSYSLGAERVLMPHIVAPMGNHHGWDVMQQHTRLLVSFGGARGWRASLRPVAGW